MTNEQLCADQEAALLLKETGLLRPEDADGYWVWESVVNHWFYEESKEKALRLTREFKSINSSQPPPIPTFRLDKVVAKLPEWVARYSLTNTVKQVSMLIRYYQIDAERLAPIGSYVTDLFKFIIYRDGKQEVNAAAKLLHLLWINGLVGDKPPKEGLV